MIARDVKITLDPETTTYAQVVDKALTAEGAKDQIWRESIVRRGARRTVPPFIGSIQGSGSSEWKRKAPDTLVPRSSNRRAWGGFSGRHSESDNWRSFLVCPRCRR